MSNAIVLLGHSEFAEMCYLYFLWETDYSPIAFAVDTGHVPKNTGELMLPVISIEDLPPKEDVSIFPAIAYNDGNKTRERLTKYCQEREYFIENFIHPTACCTPECLGSGNFIGELNGIQMKVRIGDGNIFWAHNHIGHSTSIGDYNYFSSGVTISGHCKIGNRNFFGVNCCLRDGIKIGNDIVIGMGAVVTRSLLEAGTYIGNPARKV